MLLTPFSNLTADYFGKGVYLFLGAADTGKTTRISKVAGELAAEKTVAIVDADTGQSHIGPPGTVGWAIAQKDKNNLKELPLGGIAFVGEISPVGHLLQITAAMVQCVRQAREAAETVLVDTPGLVSGSAACALWWEVVRILRPKAIIGMYRGSELNDVMRGLKNCASIIETIECSQGVKSKSPESRRAYRQKRFAEYFTDAKVFEVNLNEVGVQNGWGLNNEAARGRLVGLCDEGGIDIAMGFIIEWQDEDKVIFKSPASDSKRIRCIMVGDATVDLLA